LGSGGQNEPPEESAMGTIAGPEGDYDPDDDEPLPDVMYRIGQAHIPGYTGYLPGKKEQVGLNFSEASRGILADMVEGDEHHPSIPLVGPRPNSVYTASVDQDGIVSVMDGAIVNQKFTPAWLKGEIEAANRQKTSKSISVKQAPFGVDAEDPYMYKTTTANGAGKWATDSVASRVAHRRLDKPRNEGGRVYRVDPYIPT